MSFEMQYMSPTQLDKITSRDQRAKSAVPKCSFYSKAKSIVNKKTEFWIIFYYKGNKKQGFEIFRSCIQIKAKIYNYNIAYIKE
jgi:hypothetical protein